MSAQSFKKDVRRIAEFRAFYGSLSEIQRLWPEIVEARRAIEALIKTLKRVHGDDKYRKELARVVRDLRPKPKPKRVLFPQPGPDPKSEELRKALDTAFDLAEHEYGTSRAELLADGNKALREKRLWRLAGVLLKAGFSTPIKRKPTRSTGAHYRYEINPDKLENYVQRRSWEVGVIEKFPGRPPNEPLVAYATRLKTETNFGQAYRRLLRGYICGDKEILHRLQKALRKFRLGILAKFVTPEGLIVAGTVAIFAELSAIAPLSGATNTFLAVTLLVLQFVGLDAFCKTYKAAKVSVGTHS